MENSRRPRYALDGQKESSRKHGGGEHVLERLHTRFRLGDKYEIWGELDDSDLTFP